MGHIELAAPVTHIWYYRGVPSRICLLLDMSPKDFDRVIYFVRYIVLDPGITEFVKKQVIDDKEYLEAVAKYGTDSFKAGMGAEAIKVLLMEINLEEEYKNLKEIISSSSVQKKARAIKRIDIIDAFIKSGNNPEWLVLDVLPVIPPELRPMVQLDGGRYATSDLNDLYRRVINRNNRLKKLIELGAPNIIIRNEKRMLQEAVDALIDNGRRGKAFTGPSNRELKSLSGMLKGKQGRFRQNLLGKRVDYSGRSVIVIGPDLKLFQCGLPKEMALELFKPFVIRKLIERELCTNVKNANKFISRMRPQVWDVLEGVIREHPVLLNRAPTLHRQGIQAFEPILVEGRAIKIHPLVCSAFNADFDGDQMAVHVPLSIEAQTEARFLMLATNNILKLSDGRPIVSPTQDIVIGCYYLTSHYPNAKGEGKIFSSPEEAILAYEHDIITLQSMVQIRVTKEIDGVMYSKRLKTTIGRIIFNRALPQELGFVPRTTPEEMLDLEINDRIGKKQLQNIVEACFNAKGATETAVVLDNIKELGFKYSTISAVTASVFDMHIPKDKKKLVSQAEDDVNAVNTNYERGMLTEDERYKSVVSIWTKTTDTIQSKLAETLKDDNPIWMMASSGARGNMSQIRQLSGMRGLMKDPGGRTIELPVKSCFREGLSALEYFISSHGGRKGLADTALKTASSGYLTRRLVDISHDIIVVEEDCGDTRGVEMSDIYGRKGDLIERIGDRINGRFSIYDVVDPNTGQVYVKADEMISPAMAKAIQNAGIPNVRVRSILNCRCAHGLCAKCYGKNMSSNNIVKIGEAVGIIAAQSIGEPGTQLTMRTFHTGGVASGDDITQGLPRVEELLEARDPKGRATITDVSGVITIILDGNQRVVRVTTEDGTTKDYKLKFDEKLLVKNGDKLSAGAQITSGSIYPQDLLKATGVLGVQKYLTREVKDTYRLSGVEINDKHIEIIVRQMLRKVRIEQEGDSNLLPGQLIDRSDYEVINKKTIEDGGKPASARPTLLGITKAALATSSFLSAASFQETAKVLTDAALKNKRDPLAGLKENVIIGKLIPAGTGLQKYKNVTTMMASGSIDDYIGKK